MADERQIADEELRPAPVIAPGYTFGTVTDQIASVVLTRRTPVFWIACFAGGFSLLLLFLWAVALLFAKGVGIWGIMIPVGWGFAITNFVWWIGIGHAGTLISAILLLLNQAWRNSINRFAEAMTLFAVACAGMFPLLHMGRPWLFYWMFPYPNAMGVQPQFRSPLIWDVFAVSTYATVSLMFWFVGLLPDLATLRDRAKNRMARGLYGILAMGWRGSARHWSNHEMASLLLAGLATPLVLSVHTVVSFDFAMGHRAGLAQHDSSRRISWPAPFTRASRWCWCWPSLMRHWVYGLQGLITDGTWKTSAKVMLATGLIVAYATCWNRSRPGTSGNVYESAAMFWHRMTGPYAVRLLVLDHL
jgi:hypothetical protein